MKGAVTVVDMEVRKQKAAAFDEALAYLRGRAQSEEAVKVLRILEDAERLYRGEK